MTSDVLFQPHFDWITVSYELTDTNLIKLSNKYPNARIFEQNKGNGKKIWLTVSGFSEDYSKILLDDVQVSRFDVALDIRMDFNDVISRVFEVNLLKLDRYVVSKTGTTYYYGVGDLILRIYEKGKQLGVEGFDDWVRIEFQLRGRKARKMLCDFGSDAYLIFSALYSKYVTYHLISDFYTDTDFSFLQDTQDRFAYIDNNVLPYLRNKLYSNDASDFEVFQNFFTKFQKMLDNYQKK